ncbi:MAG: hypothetical protein AB8B50_14235 [Pirellulaceae bacterium]
MHSPECTEMPAKQAKVTNTKAFKMENDAHARMTPNLAPMRELRCGDSTLRFSCRIFSKPLKPSP